MKFLKVALVAIAVSVAGVFLFAGGAGGGSAGGRRGGTTYRRPGTRGRAAPRFIPGR